MAPLCAEQARMPVGPDPQTIGLGPVAEQLAAWPGVAAPVTAAGGLDGLPDRLTSCEAVSCNGGFHYSMAPFPAPLLLRGLPVLLLGYLPSVMIQLPVLSNPGGKLARIRVEQGPGVGELASCGARIHAPLRRRGATRQLERYGKGGRGLGSAARPLPRPRLRRLTRRCRRGITCHATETLAGNPASPPVQVVPIPSRSAPRLPPLRTNKDHARGFPRGTCRIYGEPGGGFNTRRTPHVPSRRTPPLRSNKGHAREF